MNKGHIPAIESRTRMLDSPELPQLGDSSSPDSPPVPFLLWWNRRFILNFVLWGMITATVIAFVIPKEYESTVRLMPPDQSGSSMAMLAAAASATGAASGGANLGGLAADLLGARTSAALFVGVLRSRTVEDRVIERYDLRSVYRTKQWEDARKVLEGRTDISEERRTGIITLTVTDRQPKRAAAIGQAYIDELNKLMADLNTSSASRERVFLEQRLLSVKKELDDSAKDLSEFASKNVTLDPKEQGKAMLDAAANLQGSLIAAEAQLSALRQIYTDDNVRVHSLKAQVTQMREQLNRIGGGDPLEQQTVKPGEFSYPSLRQLPGLGVTYYDLYRRAKIAEAIYEFLTKQYEIAKVEEAKSLPSVKVLDSPNVPERKSFPPRLIIMVFGAMLSFVVACAWIVSREGWKRMDESNHGKILALEMLSAVKPYRSRIASTAWSQAARGRLSRIGFRGKNLATAEPPNDEHAKNYSDGA